MASVVGALPVLDWLIELEVVMDETEEEEAEDETDVEEAEEELEVEEETWVVEDDVCADDDDELVGAVV